MLDLENIAIELSNMKSKLNEIGDSLWHIKSRKWIKNIRISNYCTKFLGRYKK